MLPFFVVVKESWQTKRNKTCCIVKDLQIQFYSRSLCNHQLMFTVDILNRSSCDLVKLLTESGLQYVIPSTDMKLSGQTGIVISTVIKFTNIIWRDV